MATKNQAQERAQRGFRVRFLPKDSSTWQSISASHAFGPFSPGDYVLISIDAPAHVNAGDETVAAIATNMQLPAGVHDFAIGFYKDDNGDPIDAVYVALFGNGAGNGDIEKVS